MKIVINKCYGGFGLSKEAYKELGLEWDSYGHGDGIDRTDPKLVKVVEKLGKKANGSFANLKIIEIPDDIQWEINDYDGIESVEEAHNSWS